MKRTKEISLNNKDYVLELNRDSFIQIDRICNIRKLYAEIEKEPYDYIDDIPDDFNPLENCPTADEVRQNEEEKTKSLRKIIERAYYVWLYPNHKLKLSEVQEILNEYFENDKKFNTLYNQFQEIMEDCVKIKDIPTDEDLKND